MTTYLSLLDLFRKWGEGEKNIAPSRSRWSLYVKDNLLYDGDEVVGFLIEKAMPRGFYYLITHFAGSFALRQRLEDYGGVPLMPHELARCLQAKGWKLFWRDRDIAEDAVTFDGSISSWVSGNATPRSCYWKDCLLHLSGEGISVGRVIRGSPKTVIVAAYGLRGADMPPSGGKPTILHLLGQVRRNPPVLWVRDAVYVHIGRLMGSGHLPANLLVQSFGGIRTPVITIRPFRPWLLEEVDATQNVRNLPKPV